MARNRNFSGVKSGADVLHLSLSQDPNYDWKVFISGQSEPLLLSGAGISIRFGKQSDTATHTVNDAIQRETIKSWAMPLKEVMGQ